MDGGDSNENASPAAAEEPHADPELAASPTTEGADLAERLVAIFGRQQAVPVTIGLSRIVILSLRGGEADDAYAYGGFGAVPASEEAIAALPETTVGEATEEECAVCLEAYKAGDTLRTMPCAHGFHESCIFQWLRVSRLCPLCRFALPAVEETESFVDVDGDDVLESIQFLYL
ncbi:unnamed protein product [Urochloa decumbens]|uniref:RING-type domain-containing protein n=1 Tax=Urochloa decumbens TaxID=240449 RepID=A0ABC8WKQ3_9POAL